MAELRLADDARAASWLTSRIRGFGESVWSLVPEGFPAYVRVFHPAELYIDPESEPVPVRWAVIAAATGKVAHPAMQLEALTGIDQYREELPGVFNYPPEIGTLPPGLARALASKLARHTRTPDRCWFAVWEGFGHTPERLRRAPRFHLPHRDYYLLTGPLECASLDIFDGGDQSSNLWWPDDETWCVASEIDLNTTYIACSEACRDDILSVSDLEAVAIEPTWSIANASDSLNTED